MNDDEIKATFSFLPSMLSLDTPDSPDWVPLAERSPMAQARWFAFYGPGKARPGRPERALTRPDENPAVASPMLYMLLEQQERDKESETIKSGLSFRGA
jgi:hypothetical protein